MMLTRSLVKELTQNLAPEIPGYCQGNDAVCLKIKQRDGFPVSLKAVAIKAGKWRRERWMHEAFSALPFTLAGWLGCEK